jgi:dTDP-4-dehydrorhamnose 3,5-epimerase
VQENLMKFRYGVVRSPCYQVHHQQGKLVRVNAGEVFNVVLDMRRYSPEFGQSVGVLLSAANQCQLWIPQGFAHGFAVLSGTAELSCKSTDYVYPEHECRVRWDDPALAIEWPAIGTPLLSPKDKTAPLLCDAPAFMENRQLSRQRWGVQRQFCAPVEVAPRQAPRGVLQRG